jgi:protein TonB
MTDHLVLPRLPASLLASAVVHALGVALAVHFIGALAMPSVLPRAEIIPISLVSLPGGGGGPKRDGTPAPVPPAPPIVVARTVAPPARAPAPIRRAVKTPAAAAAEVAAKGEPGQGIDGGVARGTAGGDGSGGDGSGGARPGYGSNPRPPYPLVARRLGLEGRVLLDVVVRPDGRAAAVTVRESSGHRVLDSTAADTVRTRWRFIPARRGDTPVESTVTVPIRFQLREG